MHGQKDRFSQAEKESQVRFSESEYEKENLYFYSKARISPDLPFHKKGSMQVVVRCISIGVVPESFEKLLSDSTRLWSTQRLPEDS